MKRQSTVQKLSSILLKQLVAFCKQHNCGIILRVGGVEYGYDAAQLQFTFGSIIEGKLSANRFFEIVGSVVPCIRKGWNSPIETQYNGLTDSEFFALVYGGATCIQAIGAN